MTRTPRPLRRYTIMLDGFEPRERIATSAGAARYADWVAASEAGYFTKRNGGFRAYLQRVTTLHLGLADTELSA